MRVLRSILFFLWLYGLMTVIGVPFLLSFFMPRSVLTWGIKFYTKGVRWGLRVIAGVRTEFRGLENMPEGPVIYAGKHQCMWDVFIPFLIMTDPAIIMKRELVWYPGLGWFSLKSQMIRIDRAGTTRTLKRMIAQAKDRVASGRQIVIFPEGTRFKPGTETVYHAAGISALYKALDIPIVPVATNAGLCWPPRGIIRTPGVAVYEVLPPIPPGLNRRELMNTLQDTLEHASTALVQEGRAVQDQRNSN